MDNELRHALTELAAGSTLRLSDGQGRAIVVFEGQLWVTQDNDTRDIVLAAGESFSLDHPGLAVVQAFRDSRFALFDAEPAVAQPSAFELHQWARRERNEAIARAWRQAAAALRRAFARLMPTRAPTPSACAGC